MFNVLALAVGSLPETGNTIIQQEWDSQFMISFKKKVLFSAAMIAIVLGILEGISFIVWKIKVPKVYRKNIRMLCSQDSYSERLKKIYFLPNTFWHHELNPSNNKNGKFINTKGTKGEDFEVPKPVGELRIICIGDSTVEGWKFKPNQTKPNLSLFFGDAVKIENKTVF
jgi:hypothetical protein